MDIKKTRKAAASIITVLVMTTLLVFLVAGWQSRLLLSLYRARAMSDILILTYAAESKVYDLIGRFIGGYANAFSFPYQETETLPDGTVIQVSGVQDGRLQTLNIKAKRLYGTTNLQVSREDLSQSSETIRDSDILFSLDCTGSMSNKACATCSTTRMDEQKRAVLNFLDRVDEETAGRVRIGISVFELKADWLYTRYLPDGTPNGLAVRPDANLTIEQIKNAVENGFTSRGEQYSPACKKLLTYTSIGSGLGFMHNYFGSVPGPGRKQIEILITDGEPNQRIPYSGCPQDIFCPGNGAYCCPGSSCYLTGWACPAGSGEAICTPYARDFLRCTLATTQDNWTQEAGVGAGSIHVGVRDPNIDTYTVTVLDNPPPEVTQIFDSYATKYYNSENASDLTELLDKIFEEISISLFKYKIKRVVPTPVR